MHSSPDPIEYKRPNASPSKLRIRIEPGEQNPNLTSSDHHFTKGPSDEWIEQHRPIHQKFGFSYSSEFFPCLVTKNHRPILSHLKGFTSRKMMRAYMNTLRKDQQKNPPLCRSASSFFHKDVPISCAEVAYCSLKPKPG